MLVIEDIGTMEYRKAWAAQEAAHAEVAEGGTERVLLVEHPAVITFGRRPDSPTNLVASPERLGELGVEVVYSDRGGDVTFHGPGQIVAYPIIRLNDHALSVGGYVRALEKSVIAALERLGVEAQRVEGAVGVWIGTAKICAIGVRIRRGVSMHGVALNVQTDLSGFELIVPCGLRDRSVTSLGRIMGDRAPTMQQAKEALAAAMRNTFAVSEPVI